MKTFLSLFLLSIAIVLTVFALPSCSKNTVEVVPTGNVAVSEYWVEGYLLQDIRFVDGTRCVTYRQGITCNIAKPCPALLEVQ